MGSIFSRTRNAPSAGCLNAGAAFCGHLERRCRIGTRIIISVDPVSEAALDAVRHAAVHAAHGSDSGGRIAFRLALPHFSDSGIGKMPLLWRRLLGRPSGRGQEQKTAQCNEPASPWALACHDRCAFAGRSMIWVICPVTPPASSEERATSASVWTGQLAGMRT